jgi:hypothetical protein
MRHRGGLRLRGDHAADSEALGPCAGVSRQSLEEEFYEVHRYEERGATPHKKRAGRLIPALDVAFS